jgi:hypothetical protein
VTKVNLKLVAIILLILTTFYAVYRIKDYYDNKQFSDYKRLIAGQLTEKEKALETANAALNTSNSKLVTQQVLNAQIKADRDNISAAFEKFKKENKLVPISTDTTVVEVKDNCGNRQFKITGTIYKQKNGLLETDRLTMKEIDANGNLVPNSTATIISSEFTYVDVPAIDTSKHLFTFRFFGGLEYNFNAFGGSAGIEWLNWHNFGLTTQALFTKSISNTQAGIGIDYTINQFKLNIAPIVAVNTYLDNPFHAYSVSAGLIFFINN